MNLQIKMNHKLDKETPRFDVQLSFDEIGVLLDDNQYRDAISLVDMYHFYIRQHQVIAVLRAFSRAACSYLPTVPEISACCRRAPGEPSPCAASIRYSGHP